MKITYTLNLEGEACPYPAIATLDALPQLKSGEILEVLCDCPQSINSIPQDAKIVVLKFLKSIKMVPHFGS